MLKRLFLLIAASGVLWAVAAAADYFPVEARNAWTFSYTSISMPVVPNPLITKDSGTVKWDIFLNRNVEMVNVYSVKQTRCLIRRTQTRSDTSIYDSIYSPPLTTIDTVILSERIDLVGIAFSTATCAFAVHDPTAAIPAGLSAKDTTISFQGSPIAGKKMLVSECSCLPKTMRSYSFTLGPTIGPVEAYIKMCPNLAGSSYQETWKLISRDYPTAVLNGNMPPVPSKTVAVHQTSGRITCSLVLGHSSPVRIDILDIKGCLLRTLLQGNLNAGAHRYSWSVPKKTAGVALLRVRTGAEDRCVRVVTGAR